MSRDSSNTNQNLNSGSTGTGSAIGGPGPADMPLPVNPTQAHLAMIAGFTQPDTMAGDETNLIDFSDEEIDPDNPLDLLVDDDYLVNESRQGSSASPRRRSIDASPPELSHTEQLANTDADAPMQERTSNTEDATLDAEMADGASAIGEQESVIEDQNMGGVDEHTSAPARHPSTPRTPARNPLTGEPSIPKHLIRCIQCGQLGHPPLECTHNLVRGYIGTNCCVIHNNNLHRTVNCPLLKEGKISQKAAAYHLVAKRHGLPPVELPWWPWLIDFEKWMRKDHKGDRLRPQTPGFADRLYQDNGVWQEERTVDPAWNVEEDNWTNYDYSRRFAEEFPAPAAVTGVPLPPPKAPKVPSVPVPEAKAPEKATNSGANRNGSMAPPNARSQEQDRRRRGGR